MINLISVICVCICIVLDQYTKYIAVEKLTDGPFTLIEGVFEFTYVKNFGAAWGMLSGQKMFFIIITIIILLLVLYFYIKTPKVKKFYPLIASEIMLFAGAIGNFIDRLKFGYVRDFIYFSLIDFPVFNVADCFVVISAILLCILIIFVYDDEKDLDFLSFKKKNGD